MQTDGNRVRRLHALGYAGRSPCRCFAPVLIRDNGELPQTGFTSISRKPTCRLANQQVLKVAQPPSVLQLRPSVSGRPVDKPHTIAMMPQLQRGNRWRGVVYPTRYTAKTSWTYLFSKLG
jgi:hypothetical protein